MNVGEKVRVIGQDGNVVAEGTYHGTGIPTKDLNPKLPHLKHFAVLIEGEQSLRYFPTGFHALIPAKQ
jgi:hypothetical protein